MILFPVSYRTLAETRFDTTAMAHNISSQGGFGELEKLLSAAIPPGLGLVISEHREVERTYIHPTKLAVEVIGAKEEDGDDSSARRCAEAAIDLLLLLTMTLL